MPGSSTSIFTPHAPLSPPLSAPLRAPRHRRRLPPPPAPLVPPPRARSALAADPRSVPRPGLRVHAAADPGRRGSRRTTTGFSSAIRPSRPWPAPSRPWCGRAGPGWATTGGPPTCTGWRRTVVRGARGRDSGRSGGAGPAARRRPIHRGGRGQLRLRAGHAGDGHQRRPGAPARVPPARSPAGAPSAPSGRRGAAIVPRRRGAAAWAFNQAIMELGALVCTARVARCGECPVRSRVRDGTAHRTCDERSHPERSEGAIAAC